MLARGRSAGMGTDSRSPFIIIWLQASVLTCCLISLVGVKWSCLRIIKQAFPPFRFDPRTALVVVMAAKGYPGEYKKGTPIAPLDAAAACPDAQVTLFKLFYFSFIYRSGYLKATVVYANGSTRRALLPRRSTLPLHVPMPRLPC